MEKLYFLTPRGVKLCGILEIANPKSREVVVMIHGYASGKDSNTYKTLSAELAKLGVNNFRFDLAGNYESEGKFEEQTISTMIEDAEAAVEFLKNRGFELFDLIGSSGGGLAAMAVAEKIKINKLALIAPVSNYVTQRTRKYGEKAIKEWKEKGYSFYDAGPRGLVRVNYTFFEDVAKNYANMWQRAEKIKCHVIIVHGDKDQDVLLSDSQELVKHFPNAKLVAIKGANHRLRVNHDDSERNKALKMIADWLAG